MQRFRVLLVEAGVTISVMSTPLLSIVYCVKTVNLLSSLFSVVYLLANFMRITIHKLYFAMYNSIEILPPLVYVLILSRFTHAGRSTENILSDNRTYRYML